MFACEERETGPSHSPKVTQLGLASNPSGVQQMGVLISIPLRVCYRAPALLGEGRWVGERLMLPGGRQHAQYGPRGYGTTSSP